MSSTGNELSQRARAWLPLGVIVIVTLTASVNRQLIGLIGQPVKVAFNLSDTQLGALMSFAAILLVIVSPLLGQMADRMDRHRVMVGSIVVWSIATAAYGLAGSYLALAVSIAVLASAESTLVPVCNSLIADRFRDGARINANLVYFAAGGLTTGVGTYVGGLLLGLSGHHFQSLLSFWPAAADWRLAMILTALTDIPLALLASFLGRDDRAPAKGSATDLSDLKLYLRDHWVTLVTFNLSTAGYLIAATTVMGWVPIYVVRHFGITPAELGMQIGMVIGIADVLGILVGFVAIKKLYRFLGPIAPRYIFQFTLIPIGALTVLQLAMTSATSVVIVLGMQNFLATFATASFNNMVQDMSAPEIRGKVFGLNTLISSVAGVPGPLLVGFLSDRFSQSPDGLLWSVIIVSTPALAISGLFCALTNHTFLRTVNAMKEFERPALTATPA